MKGNNVKKAPKSKVEAAFSKDSDGTGTVMPNKKHHKKPKKQYL